MRATWNGALLAESDKTIVIEGNHYFPPDAVDKAFLQESPRRSSCPWKGEGHYYHVVVDGETNRNAAWFYPEPKEAAKEIAGYIAFWKGVEVSE